jgi:hypothetical protein
MQRALFVLMSAVVLVFTTARFAPLAFAGADETAGAVTASLDPEPEKDTVDVSAKVSAPDVDVDSGGGAWYVNPVWIVVGLLAVGVLVAIIVAASRGGGTTVVK